MWTGRAFMKNEKEKIFLTYKDGLKSSNFPFLFSTDALCKILINKS